MLVIVNRSDKQAEISQGDIEKVVASKVTHMLPSDYRLALQALNNGRPLALDNHNKLAAGFSEPGEGACESRSRTASRANAGGGLFGRLTGRG